ncbi:SMP-30/gluconolactonase/LRE family protein [Rhizobium rhizophilum]|uniref:SMP-30/gluconolactonase/LRE family protein n=1 Tax=Rhizobium rhizophilum TaxID=1850373 RepID=A0ABY2QSZ2_9HYPH|nr:SMP-30/gluconolactonase/LRE family protein [Rhizobium rhizophilum]THV12337.1 SMP-30/gluconolactonase/LRE family protein [Rhizobium rhizophilum]
MRYTDWFEIVDPAFKSLILPNVHVDLLYTGGRWLEGPVYVPAARHLLFSDIPNNRVMRYDDVTGTVATFEAPSNFSNGHTLDREGRVLSCEHLTRSVTRREHDGSLTVLADRFEGNRLNSPNDVIADSQGNIWFTDPTYGISTPYEGSLADSEVGSRNVYRLTRDGRLDAVIKDLQQPNGLVLSHDERTLFVVDSGVQPAYLMAYALDANGVLQAGRLFSECSDGMYDGLRVDIAGHIWTSAGDGVHCLDHNGRLIGKILIPETVSNVCFGGPEKNRLFITATRNLYAVYLNVTGC